MAFTSCHCSLDVIHRHPSQEWPRDTLIINALFTIFPSWKLYTTDPSLWKTVGCWVWLEKRAHISDAWGLWFSPQHQHIAANVNRNSIGIWDQRAKDAKQGRQSPHTTICKQRSKRHTEDCDFIVTLHDTSKGISSDGSILQLYPNNSDSNRSPASSPLVWCIYFQLSEKDYQYTELSGDQLQCLTWQIFR